MILLIESVVHKFFGGQHGHSHFPSEETFARRIVSTEVRIFQSYHSYIKDDIFYPIALDQYITKPLPTDRNHPTFLEIEIPKNLDIIFCAELDGGYRQHRLRGGGSST